MGTSVRQSAIRRSVGLFVACWLLAAAYPARAQVDMNGPWDVHTILGQSFICSLTFTQTGTSLSIAGTCGVIDAVTLSGTIDLGTGNFTASGTAGTECPSMTITLGMASMDNRSFFAGYLCSSGPNGGFGGLIQGHRCGNGVVDAISGEQCDVAIHECCSGVNFECQFSPPGAFCSDGNQCTDDMCDGAGTCLHSNRTGPCDDGLQCTDPDECIDGACTTTVLPDGTACEDFNDCTTQSCQAGACEPTNVPDGTPCDDFEMCLAGEACEAGVCLPGDPVVCPACRTCSEPYGCLPDEYPGHNFHSPIEDALHLKKATTDLMRWKWESDSPVTVEQFGDPVGTTGYELCVFDSANLDPVTFRPSLMFAEFLPAGSDWKSRGSGFVFKNAADKVKVRLKAGAVGEAKIVVRAKGVANPVEYLPPLGSFVHVQLRTVPGVLPPMSFYSFYQNPVTSTEKHYKAQTPEP